MKVTVEIDEACGQFTSSVRFRMEQTEYVNCLLPPIETQIAVVRWDVEEGLVVLGGVWTAEYLREHIGLMNDPDAETADQREQRRIEGAQEMFNNRPVTNLPGL